MTDKATDPNASDADTPAPDTQAAGGTDALVSAAPAPALDALDVHLAYRLFLNRAPSPSELEQMHAAHSSVSSLRQAFMSSSEFGRQYAPIAAKNASPPTSAPQETALERAPTLKKLPLDLQPCDAQKVVFLHVPKCGGTTLHDILGQWYGAQNLHPERFNELYSYTGGQLASSRVFSGHYDYYATTLIPGPRTLISFLRDPAERLVSLYNFHRAHTADIIKQGNLLLPQWANTYDIATYFAQDEIRSHPAINNMIVRVFSNVPQTTPGTISAPLRETDMDEMLEQALANLEKFAFVGFLDSYDSDVSRLADMLGKPRLDDTPKQQVLDTLMEGGGDMKKIEKQRPNAACMDRIEEIIAYDRKFYARARELFA